MTFLTKCQAEDLVKMDKCPSKWPWLSQIGHIDLTFNQIYHYDLTFSQIDTPPNSLVDLIASPNVKTMEG
jgi:hypothetical protein